MVARLIGLLALLLATGAHAQAVTSTRITTYDWRCTDAAGVTISEHQRQDTAIVTCANLVLKDGKARLVEGGRYRITSTAAAPPVTGAQLSWQAPLRNTDGTTITQPLTYRVEQQAGTAWQPLATVTGTSYAASAPTGCWRVVAIAGGAESDPTSPACKP